MLYIGIDPGVSGAVAGLDGDSMAVRFFDTPTVTVKKAKKNHEEYDRGEMVRIVRDLMGTRAHSDVLVVIEKVSAMPSIPGKDGVRRSMGATSAFNFGFGAGLWHGIVTALELPMTLVHPATWKKLMMSDASKDKGQSRIIASSLFPQASSQMVRKMDHARADALLLAEYGRRTSALPRPAQPPQDLFHAAEAATL